MTGLVTKPLRELILPSSSSLADFYVALIDFGERVEKLLQGKARYVDWAIERQQIDIRYFDPIETGAYVYLELPLMWNDGTLSQRHSWYTTHLFTVSLGNWGAPGSGKEAGGVVLTLLHTKGQMRGFSKNYIKANIITGIGIEYMLKEFKTQLFKNRRLL